MPQVAAAVAYCPSGRESHAAAFVRLVRRRSRCRINKSGRLFCLRQAARRGASVCVTGAQPSRFAAADERQAGVRAWPLLTIWKMSGKRKARQVPQSGRGGRASCHIKTGRAYFSCAYDAAHPPRKRESQDRFTMPPVAHGLIN